MTVGSLFAGIGGFDLGFERAGFEIKWQVEIDPYCRAVLRRHWPDATCYFDVRRVRWPERVDVLCGGFPCQDVSFANVDGQGLDGERSGLWFQYDRLVGEVRPDYVVVENVAALTARGLGRVLGNLAGRRFHARWGCVPVCAFGWTHPRRRLFIVAYADRLNGRPGFRDRFTRAFRSLQEIDGFTGARTREKARLANPSELYGGADGVPHRLERNRAIGNSVHPAVAQWIAERIKEAEAVEAERQPASR
jgi:DNA (cytosine-5)-methyltransferase 1